MAAAGVLAGAATALVLAIMLPWLAYLEIWPVLIAACGLGYLLTTDAAHKPGWLLVAVLVLVAVPAAGIGVSGLYLSIMSGVQGSPALVIAALVLLIGLLSPQVLVATAVARRWLPAMFALIGVGLLSVGFMSSSYTASQPRPDTAAYALNSATGQAFWATADEHLDGYTSQLLTAPVPRTLDELIGAGGSSMLVSTPAPTAQLAPPVLTLRDRRTDGETQTLSLHLASQRGAWRAVVFPGPGVELMTAAFVDTAPHFLRRTSNAKQRLGKRGRPIPETQ